MLCKFRFAGKSKSKKAKVGIVWKFSLFAVSALLPGALPSTVEPCLCGELSCSHGRRFPLLPFAFLLTGKEFLAKDFRDAMFGPDQPLDAAKYYLILPDAIGLGGSSKPSDGLHDRFPHYGYKDMVAAEERLVTEGLGIKHLRLVFGTSMGGMHAWLWGEQYPALMDAIIPVACLADKIAGRNLLWRRIITTAVRSDPEWEGGDYRRPPSSLARVFPIFKLMTSNAAQLQKELSSVEQTNALLESIAELGQSSQIDANDLVHRLEASADYDPAPDLEKIQAAVLAINFADDELNPPELGIFDRAKQSVRNGQFVLIPASSPDPGPHKPC